MSQLSRTGVSIEEDLLKEFDRLTTKRGYQNRSEAFRDLVREALLAEIVDSNKPVVGTLTFLYDPHVPNLSHKLTETQHVAGTMVLAATHVHLDHHYCLEVIILKGRAKDIQAVADSMLALRGGGTWKARFGKLWQRTQKEQTYPSALDAQIAEDLQSRKA